MQTFDRAQTTPFTAGFPTEPTVGDSAMTTTKNNNDTTNANERSTNSLGLPLGLRYGAPEIKAYIQQSTWRGFAAAVSATALLLGGYMIVINSRSANNTKKVAINKMRLSQLPPPPAQQESTPPPPPPTTIAGPAARAGTPVPVPDALVTPDMKDFASIEDVSRASTTGGDGDDKGFLGLAKDVDVEVREEEPDAYGFISVEKEPYIDLEDLQKRVVYPEIARRAGIEGKVNIRVLVSKTGKPKKSIIESSDADLLNNAATQAVMSAIFTPAVLGGQPIDCWVSIPINFRMK
jgi:periplasmic protein TonB